MNLLLVNYEYPPLGGGAGKATAAIAREMASLGHRVRVLTAAFKGLPHRSMVGGYTVIRCPAVRRRVERSAPLEMLTFMLGALPVALREAWRDRPDACIAFFTIPSGPVAYLLSLIFRVPYLISLRGGDVPGFQPYDLATYHRITKPFIRFLWKHSAGVAANSAGLRDLAQQTAPSRFIHVIPNGIDIPTAPLQTASWIEVAEGPPRLLFVGRVVRQKGLDYLLEALAHLDAPFVLSIVGDGEQRPSLEEAARRLELADQILFLGWQQRDTLADFYTSADIFVSPSLDEGMSNAVLEAMAYRLPVVASSVPGSLDLVISGETGMLVPPRDPAALADALRALLGDPALRQRMGEAGYRRAQRFTWRDTAQHYLTLARGTANEQRTSSAILSLR